MDYLFNNNAIVTQQKTASKGVGLAGMTFIVFLILKLAEIGAVASWSWWWVTAPLWMPFAAAIGIIVAILAIYLLVVGTGKLFGN